MLVVKYRTKLDIVAAILNVVGHGRKKTRIMQLANLSYKLLEKYMEPAIEVGLIRIRSDVYEVTENGRSFLEKYKHYSSNRSHLERKLKDVMFEREALTRMCGLANSANSRSKTEEAETTERMCR